MQSRAWMWTGAAIATVVAMTASSLAQPHTDSQQRGRERGRELAVKLCTGCHVVSRETSGAMSTDVPSFPAMANRQGTSAEQLAGRIIVPHPAMPGVPLTANEIRDLVAYIMSLKAN